MKADRETWGQALQDSLEASGVNTGYKEKEGEIENDGE